jgi:hypothetical protein
MGRVGSTLSKRSEPVMSNRALLTDNGSSVRRVTRSLARTRSRLPMRTVAAERER